MKISRKVEEANSQIGWSINEWKDCIVDFMCPAIFIAAILFFSSGCASEPVPVYSPAPSTFDRAWSAALAAARDEGVQIVSEDRVSGIVNGTKSDQEVTISMRTQADGNVRVEISQRGPKDADPGLAGRISRAYDRRMGR